MHRLLLQLLAASLCTTAAFAGADAQSVDPLYDTTAYSLSIHHEGVDSADYFPIGVLFPRDRNELASYGFDFTEQAVSPVVDPDDGMLAMDWLVIRHTLPTPPPLDPNDLGLFAASWAWHMMPIGTEIPGYGSFTQSRSYFDPNVRRFLLAADSSLARLYGSSATPTRMWSFDNEWEGSLDYSPLAMAGFIDWLKTNYSTLNALNQTWGAAYQDWNDVAAPTHQVPIANPAAWLDWHAYQDGYFTQLMADRYKAIYDNDPEHRGIAQKTTQQSFDLPTPGKDRVLDPAMLCDLTRPYGGWFGVDIYDADDSYIYQVNFASQCIRPLDGPSAGKLFLTETNNHGGPGYQFANSIWRSLGNGVKAYDFFCFGMPGATGDSDVYGMTSPNTLLRDKAPYAVRFAYDVRRTESFWEQSKPSSGVHRVALLLDRQDMLLDPETPGNEWAGPTNSRESVFVALRQAGYWVDVIPYTKLNAEFLKQYDALLLVGSDHLTAAEIDQISLYVQHGGVLLADMLAGYYDEHNRIVDRLEPVTGVKVVGIDTGATVSITIRQGNLVGHECTAIKPAGSWVVGSSDSGAPLVTEAKYGQGKAIYFATRLGELHGGTDNVFADWLAGLLEREQISPSYDCVKGSVETASLRVEQPFAAVGNLAIVVASVSPNAHGATAVRMQLPEGNWSHALWSPAENQSLSPVATHRMPDGRYEFDLPPFATAGMLLLLNDHPPLISVHGINTVRRGVDGSLPVLTPGAAAPVTVSLVNPSRFAAAAGTLTARALRGWRVEPSVIRTPRLQPFGMFTTTITVTAPDKGVLPYAERMYPLNFHWFDGAADLAVTTTPVGVDIPQAECPWLLSENATYPDDYPRKMATHATYRYLFDTVKMAGEFSDPGAGADAPDTALQDGYSRWLVSAESAAFQAPYFTNVPIEFDLKDVYPLHEVRLLSSSFGGYPTKMTVAVSSDGTNFVNAGTAEPDGGPGSGKWLDLSNLDGMSGRYVRLNVSLQGGGGQIDEVEIWGYPKPGA